MSARLEMFMRQKKSMRTSLWPLEAELETRRSSRSRGSKGSNTTSSKGLWRPGRRESSKRETLAERIVDELYRDGETGAQIASSMGVDEAEVESILESGHRKEEKLGA